MSYKLIVFDWDGTLYDSASFIVDCVQRAASIAGVEVPAAQTVRQMIGLSVDQALKRAMPDLSPMEMANLIKVYRQCVRESGQVKPQLFAGSEEALIELDKAGYWLAIATGKSRSGLLADLEQLNMQHLFMCLRSADETQSKPHPQMLLEIMDEMGVTPEATLMVGDTEYDLQLAQNAKVDAVAAVYGVHQASQLESYPVKYFLKDIRDLPDWLKKQEKQEKTLTK